MRAASWLSTFLTISLAPAMAPAAPVPAADTPAAVAAADLIVVGRVEQLRAGNGITSGPGFSISIDRRLKGSAAPRRQVAVRLDPSLGGVAEGQYGIFLLKRDGAGFSAVDPFRPALPASPLRRQARGTSAEALSGVAAELAEVLTTPADTLLDPVKGLGNLDVGSRSAQVDGIDFDAAEALSAMPYAVAGSALRRIAASGPPNSRVWALAALFSMEGPAELSAARLALLDAMAPSLVKPAADLALSVRILAHAMQGRIGSADAVPTLALLLRSERVEMRRAAASLLGDIATSAALAPLGTVALNDPDQRVRYYAVLGLAAVKGLGSAPALALYRKDEARYLAPSRAAARTSAR